MSHEEFEQYIKAKYPLSDITRDYGGYSNFHIQSLWDLYVHLSTPEQLAQGKFEEIFKNL